jgi:hypothetical protein
MTQGFSAESIATHPYHHFLFVFQRRGSLISSKCSSIPERAACSTVNFLGAAPLKNKKAHSDRLLWAKQATLLTAAARKCV